MFKPITLVRCAAKEMVEKVSNSDEFKPSKGRAKPELDDVFLDGKVMSVGAGNAYITVKYRDESYELYYYINPQNDGWLEYLKGKILVDLDKIIRGDITNE